MVTRSRKQLMLTPLAILLLISLALSLAGCGSRTPAEPDFTVISSPQGPVVANVTATPVPSPTPQPIATDTPLPVPDPNQGNSPSTFQMSPATLPPTLTPSATPTETPIPTDTPVPVPTATIPPTATPRPPRVPDEPRVGGIWDMEAGFVDWSNPYGDDCSGSKVAVGWQGFTSRGQYGSSCFVLNQYGPNVFSGQHSQQVTFDFVDSHAGLYRVFDSKPGHTYQFLARLRHVWADPPMQFHFGIDPTGGTDWQAETVIWSPWKEFIVDQWMTHEQTYTTPGGKTTIFIKGFHPVATQGGATFIDGIEIIDLS